jgi:hypothetical protein
VCASRSTAGWKSEFSSRLPPPGLAPSERLGNSVSLALDPASVSSQQSQRENTDPTKRDLCLVSASGWRIP